MNWSAHKRQTLDLLHSTCPMFHIVLVTEGCLIPAELLRLPNVTLVLGYGLARQIPDLAFDDDAIRGTLSFNGAPVKCVLPWTSLIAAGPPGAAHVIWTRPDAVQTPAEVPAAEATAPATPPATMRSKLKLVD